MAESDEKPGEPGDVPTGRDDAKARLDRARRARGTKRYGDDAIRVPTGDLCCRVRDALGRCVPCSGGSS